MTAEVAILNRHGLALAADSAVTVGEERVWTYTNKIFSLGPYNDIAIMIYGNGDFAGFPWETVIKSFKRHVNKERFETVSDCTSRFFSFLSDDRWSDDVQSNLVVYSIIINELSEISNTIQYSSKKEFRNKLSDVVEFCLNDVRSKKVIIQDISKVEFISEFRAAIDDLRSEQFSEHIPKYIKDRIDEYLFEYFRRAECPTRYQSGIVICGFGTSENYPVVIENIVDGRHKSSVRYWLARNTNLNKERFKTGEIIPFAQSDMSALFMEGISHPYIGYFFKLFEGILEKKTNEVLRAFNGTTAETKVERAIQQRVDNEIRKQIIADFETLRMTHFINPLMRNVQSLPREEMAAMAEALVELTSLRRKIDSAIQTVAGPVDVLLISKADGLVWIKRKHYFDKDKNAEFFARKSLLEG